MFFTRILKYSGLWPFSVFSLGVSVCTHTRQVEHPRCSRTGRVQKIHKISRKNTIFNEHPVYHWSAKPTAWYAEVKTQNGCGKRIAAERWDGKRIADG